MKRPEGFYYYAAFAAFSGETAAAELKSAAAAWLEVLWLSADEVEVFVLIFIFVIVVIKVAEAGGEGGCGQDGGGVRAAGCRSRRSSCRGKGPSARGSL